MRICILAKNEDVETVRQTAKDNGLHGISLLTIPVSQTGELPATHWFCNFKVSEEMRDKLLGMQSLSEMEVTDNWMSFLKSRDLKVCEK